MDYLDEAICRIRRMEELYDALREDPGHPSLGKLVRYYESGQWLRDYELDEQGLLPRDLKRGVLSQDGIYNLLDNS